MFIIKMAEVRDYTNQFFKGNPMGKPKPTSLKEGEFSTPIGGFLYYNERLIPALDFFWKDKVLPENRQKYYNLLGELYELFLTPQVIPIPPFRNCSYLKRYELYMKNPDHYLKMINHILYMLSIQSLNTMVRFETYDIEIQGIIVLPDDLKSVLSQWYNDPSKSKLVIPLTLNKGGHLVFVALFKNNFNKLEMVYIDGHGFNTDEADYDSERQREVRHLIEQFLVNSFDVTVIDVVPTCPNLQTYQQGGNCVQWFLFNFAMFLFNRNFLISGSTLLKTIGAMPDINVQLFGLALFLRTLPRVGLVNYVDYRIYEYDELINQCIEEEDQTRKHILQESIFTKDCYSQPVGVCPPKDCQQCAGTCHFKSSVVHLQNNDCAPLSAKQIARKMLNIYLLIRKLTGQDPRSMRLKDIEDQLNFEEPTTAEMYIYMYGFDSNNLLQRKIAFSSRQEALLEQQQNR